MVCYGVLQRLLTRSFPNRDQQALHNTLLKALPDLVSGVPPLKLWELSRLVRADAELSRSSQSATSHRDSRRAFGPIRSSRIPRRASTLPRRLGLPLLR